MHLNLELSRALKKISEENAKLVCVQLPEGLKSKTDLIQQEIESKTPAKVIFWFDSCYGACDFPRVVHLGFDLFIAFGHSKWVY